MAWIDYLRPPVVALSTTDAVPVPGPSASPWRAVMRALGIDSVFSGPTTGLGVVGTDPGSTWVVRPRPVLGYQQIDTLYRQWPLARRLVDLLPTDALSSPWRLDDETRRDVAADLDERIHLRATVREWAIRARLNGAALAVPYFRGQGPDLSQPLPAGFQGDVTAVQVFAGEEVSVLAWDTDPSSPRFGRPLMYAVSPMVPGASVYATIHASRGVWLGSGMPLPPIMRQQYASSTDLPVLEAYWVALGHRWQVDAAAAALAPRMIEGVLSIPGLAAVSGADPMTSGGASTPAGYANAIAQGFARSASVVGVGVLDSEMQYERHGAALTGFADVDATTRREIAAVEGFPQRRIFGDEPSGLGQSGEGAIRQWSIIVEGYRQTVIGPALMDLYRLIYGSRLVRPRLTWEPLERPGALELAQIRQAHAAADASYVSAGILLPEEVRQRWTGPEYVEELTLDPATGGEFAAAMLGGGVEAPATPPTTDADDYAIPDAVAGNAAKAIRWREEHGDAVQGGTETGWRRARQLAGGGRVSADDVVTIAAWWARHRDHATEPDAEYADEPWRDAGYVAGLLWGGRSGDTWATEARAGIE